MWVEQTRSTTLAEQRQLASLIVAVKIVAEGLLPPIGRHPGFLTTGLLRLSYSLEELRPPGNQRVKPERRWAKNVGMTFRSP